MTKGSGREMTNADTALGAEARVRFHMDDNDLRAGIPANVPTLRGYTVGNSSTGLKPRRPLAQLGRAVALHAGGRRFESCAARLKRPKLSIHATPYSQFRRQSQGVMQGLLAPMALVIRGRTEIWRLGKEDPTLGRRLRGQYPELEAW